MSTPRVPEDLAAAYGVTLEDLRFVTEVQNHIFTYRRGDAEYILRLTPDSHQSREQVMAEVDWVCDLVARGVPVAAPVPAIDGSLCQSVEAESGNFTPLALKR